MTFPDLLDAVWFHRGKTYKRITLGIIALILFII